MCREGVTRGGSNHRRRRTEVGHVQAILSRAGVTVEEVRTLHALSKAVLAKVEQV
jgi:tRNA C32,U32 (ribose-2'-O)-methylase TrmJ